MEHRRDGDHDVGVGHLEALPVRISVHEQLEVGQLDPLRPAGGPRGEQDHGCVTGVPLHERRRVRLNPGEEFIEICADAAGGLAARHDKDLLDTSRGRAFRCLGDRGGRCDDCAGVRAAKVISDLGRLQQHVHRDYDASCLEDAEVGQ